MYCVRNIVYFICIIILSISCSKNEEVSALQTPTSTATFSVTSVAGQRKIPSYFSKQFGIYASCPNANNPNTQYVNIAYDIEDLETGELVAANSEEAILYPSNDAETEFWGYYPYTANPSSFSVSNWANQTNPENLDLLISTKAKGKMKSPRVELSFYHKFSKIILNLSADSEFSQLQTDDLDNVVVTADGMNIAITYDIISDTTTYGRVNTVPITFRKLENGTVAEAIVCPGYNTNVDRLVTFTLKKDGQPDKTCTWKIDAGTELKSGYCYVWNLRLKGDGLVEAIMTGKFNNWTDVSHGDLDLRDQ